MKGGICYHEVRRLSPKLALSARKLYPSRGLSRVTLYACVASIVILELVRKEKREEKREKGKKKKKSNSRQSRRESLGFSIYFYYFVFMLYKKALHIGGASPAKTEAQAVTSTPSDEGVLLSLLGLFARVFPLAAGVRFLDGLFLFFLFGLAAALLGFLPIFLPARPLLLFLRLVRLLFFVLFLYPFRLIRLYARSNLLSGTRIPGPRSLLPPLPLDVFVECHAVLGNGDLCVVVYGQFNGAFHGGLLGFVMEL